MIRYGFAMNYWLGPLGIDFHKALDEIALTEWDGIEMASDFLNYFLSNINELKKLLKLHNLSLASFYSHLNLVDDKYFEVVELEIIKKKIKLLNKLGADILLLDGGAKEIGGNPNKRLEKAVKNIKVICDVANSNGLKATWHQHWGTLFDNRKSFEYLMDNTKDSKLYFCPDTAQLLISNIDPYNIIEKYMDRVSYIHLKDVKENVFINRYKKPTKKTDSRNNSMNIDGNFFFTNYRYLENSFLDDGCYYINSRYKITEIARGIIDFKPIIKLIKEKNFNGWIIVDQDYTEYKSMHSLDVNLKNLKLLFKEV